MENIGSVVSPGRTFLRIALERGAQNNCAKALIDAGLDHDLRLLDAHYCVPPDAPAKILAEKEIPTEGKQVPIPFELTYSPSDIQRSHHYSVRATIKSGDKLLFTSTTSNPVLINGVPSEIRVVVQPPATTPPPAVPLEGTHWTLTELISKKVPPADGRAEAYLQFTADGNRISGSTGCNRLTGTYEKNDKALPRRLIVTYRSEPGQPSYVAELSDWNFSIHPTDADFTFQPPEGATPVELKPVANAPAGKPKGAKP